MELTTIAKEKLGTDEVKMRIALDLGKSYLTMRRWIIKGHSNISKKESIEAIMNHTGLEEHEIFVDNKHLKKTTR